MAPIPNCLNKNSPRGAQATGTKQQNVANDRRRQPVRVATAAAICQIAVGCKGLVMTAEFHESLRREEHVEIGSDRSFGIVFGSACLIFAAVSYWRDGHAWPWWLMAGFVFLAASIAYPSILAPLNLVWAKVGLILGGVMQPVVMALLFFITVVPTALIVRILKKDLLRLRLDASLPTYWIERAPSESAESSFKNQF